MISCFFKEISNRYVNPLWAAWRVRSHRREGKVGQGLGASCVSPGIGSVFFCLLLHLMLWTLQNKRWRFGTYHPIEENEKKKSWHNHSFSQREAEKLCSRCAGKENQSWKAKDETKGCSLRKQTDRRDKMQSRSAACRHVLTQVAFGWRQCQNKILLLLGKTT